MFQGKKGVSVKFFKKLELLLEFQMNQPFHSLKFQPLKIHPKIRYQPDLNNFNILYDPDRRVKCATLIKIIEWITSHTPMPNQKSFGQESPEEFETRCFLHVYKLLRNKNGEYVTQGIDTKLISFFRSFAEIYEHTSF